MSGPYPAVIASRVGFENPAHPLDAESPAAGVDEGEALASRRVVDQRFRGLAQDLILGTQPRDLRLVTAELTAELDDRGFEGLGGWGDGLA